MGEMILYDNSLKKKNKKIVQTQSQKINYVIFHIQFYKSNYTWNKKEEESL